MPARPARQPASSHVTIASRSVLTPVTAARSLFSDTARIERPMLVEARSQPTTPMAASAAVTVIVCPGEIRIGPTTKTSA